MVSPLLCGAPAAEGPEGLREALAQCNVDGQRWGAPTIGAALAHKPGRDWSVDQWAVTLDALECVLRPLVR